MASTRCQLNKLVTPIVAALMLVVLVLSTPVNVASATDIDDSIDLGTAAGDPSTVEFLVGPEHFPNDSIGQELAAKAAAIDPYRATNAEIADLQQSIEQLVADRRNSAVALQPAIDKLADLEAAEQQKRDELQLAADDLGRKVSGLAVQSFRSANRAYAAMSIEAVESDETETQRRTAQSLEMVAVDSTDAYTKVSTELRVVVASQKKLQTHKAELEQQQANHQQALASATNLQENFNVLAQTRSQRIQQRKDEAIAGERADTPLAQVGPFIVNQEIAEALTALLADAAEDGIVFAGWGQRPVSRQIELRQSHCGNSEWAIFDKRSGTCSPPTARPGRSQHELGLAIDFTENGSILNRSSPGFVWLRANAARYGLKNLPSEPWHWSTTGN